MQLEYLHQQSKEQLKWTEGTGLKERGDVDSIRYDLQAALATLEVYLKFIHSGKHSDNYSEAQHYEYICTQHCYTVRTAENPVKL